MKWNKAQKITNHKAISNVLKNKKITVHQKKDAIKKIKR